VSITLVTPGPRNGHSERTRRAGGGCTCHCSNSDQLQRAVVSYTWQTRAAHVRNTSKLSGSSSKGQLGPENEISTWSRLATRVIRKLKPWQHYSNTAHFKHSSLFNGPCSTPQCTTPENHCPAPCVLGQVPDQQHRRTRRQGRPAHCTGLGCSSASTLVPVTCAHHAAHRCR
jgi:hypothetical protein